MIGTGARNEESDYEKFKKSVVKSLGRIGNYDFFTGSKVVRINVLERVIEIVSVIRRNLVYFQGGGVEIESELISDMEIFEFRLNKTLENLKLKVDSE